MSETSVRVICRFRPVNDREKLEAKKLGIKKNAALATKTHLDINTVEVKVKNKPSLQFVMDEILGPSTNQEDCFQIVAEPTVLEVLKGYNATIFAYGQTGSGKTHSMYGPEGKFNASASGIVPRAISMVFQSLESNDNILEFTMKVAFIEIYLEKMRDLLNIDGSKLFDKSTKSTKKKVGKNKNKKKIVKKVHKSAKQKQKEKDARALRVRTLPNGSTIIQNLYTEECSSLMDVLALIKDASSHRTTSSTTMNHTSSRSHLVMITNITQKMQDGSTRLSKLNFADLAGSEKVKKTNATGIRLDEAKMINKSLTQLGIVIRALSEKKSFISYRDSLLTHILKDSLGGNTKTTLLCTTSPHIFNRDETISTLRFASRTKLISNVVYKNTVLSPQQMTKLIKNLQNQIVNLKHKLQDKVIQSIQDDHKTSGFQSSSTSHQLDPDVQKQMINDLSNYKTENIKMSKDIEKHKNKEDELNKIIAQLRSEIEDWKEKHANSMLEIEKISIELDQSKLDIIDRDKIIAELNNKLTELNAQLIQTQSAANNDKQKKTMQLEFLSNIYQQKIKKLEAEQKEMDHQLSLTKQFISKNKQQIADLQSQMGNLIDVKVATKIQGLQNETLFYEQQEMRLNKILGLFREEKGILQSKDDSLTQQLNNLQKYLNLKDKMINDLRKEIDNISEKLKLKELQIVRGNTSVQQLNETVKELQDENAKLEKRMAAYFKFKQATTNSNLGTPVPGGGLDDQIARGLWNSVKSHSRRLSDFTRSSSKALMDRNDPTSPDKIAAENLLQQQDYLEQFAQLRAQREKERLEEERRKREQAQEEELKRKKAAELKAAAEERERKLKEKAEKAALKAQQEKDLAAKKAKDLKDLADKNKVKKIAVTKVASIDTSIPSLSSNNSKSDGNTLTPYKKKKRRRLKKFKSSRSKVLALVAGFEQIEDDDIVFDEPDDDATMMLRMLDNATISEADPRKWSIDDVATWLKSIDLGIYENSFRKNKIDGNILYNDIREKQHLFDLKVSEIHAPKILREIQILRTEQENAEIDDMKAAAFDASLDDDDDKQIDLDPFEMIKELFEEMDVSNAGYIDRDNFDQALAIAGVTSLDTNQVDMVYNQFHFSAQAGITLEELTFALGPVFVQHHCTDASMAFRLATVLFLQETGMISGYADNLDDLFENTAEVQKNLIEWQNTDNLQIKPFLEEKLMKLMKICGSKITVIDGKRVKTTEEFDDMNCARMAGDGVHLSVLKIWWAFSTVHGIQATYTSLDGKHFTSIRHASNTVNDDNDDLHETMILLKHDEFIKYVSVSATNFIHNITVVTTLGKKYDSGNNRSAQIIQYKPPTGCGILAFYGSVTHRGLTSLSCYVIRNEKIKLKMAFKRGIEAAHRRAKLRSVLKGKLKSGIIIEEAIGFLLGKYDVLNIRRICENDDKAFIKKIVEQCNKVCAPKSIKQIKSKRRKLTALNITFKPKGSGKVL